MDAELALFEQEILKLSKPAPAAPAAAAAAAAPAPPPAVARAPAGPAPIGVRGPLTPPHARDPAHRAPLPAGDDRLGPGEVQRADGAGARRVRARGRRAGPADDTQRRPRPAQAAPHAGTHHQLPQAGEAPRRRTVGCAPTRLPSRARGLMLPAARLQARRAGEADDGQGRSGRRGLEAKENEPVSLPLRRGGVPR